jgi:hypothetical protein
MTRTFEDREAKRERVPLWVGLFGASGSGKSFSALRLAKGIQRVFPGDILAIDTEAGRLRHYASEFSFRHVEFKAPFAPADYLAAINHCVAKRPAVVVVDSFSHVWEGAGGVLEMADAGGRKDAGKWAKPKAELRKMLDAMLQMNINLVACFRARPKIKMVPGKEPIDLGYQPIGSDELVYEFMLNCLLPPGSNGVPSWTPEFHGERAMLKLPLQFREMFAQKPPPQLTEDLGEQLARWAAGGVPASKPAAPAKPEPQPEPDPGLLDFVNAYKDVATWEELSKLESQRKQIWEKLNGRDKQALKTASDAAAKRIGKGAA